MQELIGLPKKKGKKYMYKYPLTTGRAFSIQPYLDFTLLTMAIVALYSGCTLTVTNSQSLFLPLFMMTLRIILPYWTQIFIFD